MFQINGDLDVDVLSQISFVGVKSRVKKETKKARIYDISEQI